MGKKFADIPAEQFSTSGSFLRDKKVSVQRISNVVFLFIENDNGEGHKMNLSMSVENFKKIAEVVND